MNPPAAAASGAIPFLAMDATALPSAAHWGLVVMLCLGVLVLILGMLRRRALGSTGWPHRTDRWIEVLEARPVGPGVQLVVVRYAGRRLLLGVGSGVLCCLCDDPEGQERSS